LTDIGALISNSSGKNHDDLNSLNSNLGSKLDAINDSINNKPVSQSTDMTETNNHLQNIDDKLDALDDIPDGVNPDEDMNSAVSESASELSSNLMSYVENYTPIISLNGVSGSCTDVSFNMPIGGTFTIEFAKHVDKFSFLSVILYFISIFGAVVIVLMTP